MCSFLEFYEQMRWSQAKQVLAEHFCFTEAEFKKGEFYPNTVQLRDPTKTGVATDGNVGRKTQNMVDQGSKMDSMVNRDKWNQAVEERPELQYYSMANDAMRQDRKVTQAAQDKVGGGDYIRGRSGRVTGSVSTGKESYESKLSQNTDPASRYALTINNIILRNADRYKGVTIPEAFKMLQQDFPAGGKEDLVTHLKNIKEGIKKLFGVAKKDLFAGDQKTGFTINPKVGESDPEDMWASNRGSSMLMQHIDKLKKQIQQTGAVVFQDLKGNGEQNADDLVWFDPRVLKLVRELHKATTIFTKEGKITGPKADEIKDLHRSMGEILGHAQTPNS